MDKKPNEHLNEFVAYYIFLYLAKVDFQRTGSRLNDASWKFLSRTDIDPNSNPFIDLDGFCLGTDAARLQKQLVTAGGVNFSLRSVIRENPTLLPLVAHGPQAWLIKTYDSMLRNIYELDMGIKKYGLDQEVYRDIVDNVKAARLMFDEASRKIANKIYELYGDQPNLALVEGGAGNGAAMLTNLEKFPRSSLPKFLITDIDEKTRLPAEELFRSKGFSAPPPWLKVDLGDPQDLLKIQNLLKRDEVVFSVNFIIHEHRTILDKFFRAMSQGLPSAKLAISEFFLPEDEDAAGHTFPWWFVYLHEVSGQYLRTEREFINAAQSFGYTVFDRLDHQHFNNKPLVSTLFLTRN